MNENTQNNANEEIDISKWSPRLQKLWKEHEEQERTEQVEKLRKPTSTLELLWQSIENNSSFSHQQTYGRLREHIVAIKNQYQRSGKKSSSWE